ncbi:unnamed protein product, partial [Rotaria sp. Silwood2]
NGEMTNDDTIVISRDALSALMVNNDTYTPRTVVLQRGKKGFGFVLRGSRIAGKLFQPTPSFPALQFLDSIEKGSNADKAGLKQNDYVLEINGINVTSMPHEECVNLIKRAGDTIALKIVTANISSKIHSNHDSQSYYTAFQSLPYRRKEDLDRTLAEYEYGSMSEAYLSISKPLIENLPNGSSSLRIKNKPIVPERDSSLYDFFTNNQNQQVYNRFQPLIPAISVPNLSLIKSNRCDSNSSSNEADEELSLSSMNSNQIVPTTNLIEENGIGIYMTPSLSLSTTNMSTFKTTSNNHLPSKPSEVKRRSNNRKQISTTLNLNNNTLPKTIENEISVTPPPPPPFPTNFDSINKIQHQTSSTMELKQTKVELNITTPKNDFQMQIEQAKSRLKKLNIETSSKTMVSSTKSNGLNKPTYQNNFTNSNNYRSPSLYNPPELKNIIIEDKTPSNGFPPPPSPSTLRRSSTTTITAASIQKTSVVDPRLDINFSSVIAQRAAASKARRYENPIGLECNSNGLPPSTTFYNNCITTNGIQTNNSSCPQRFSATANQLLENLKRRGGNLTSINSFIKNYH